MDPADRRTRDIAIASAHRGGEGLSLRQLGRVHGLSASLIHRICRRVGDDWRIRRGFKGSAGERPKKNRSLIWSYTKATGTRKK